MSGRQRTAAVVAGIALVVFALLLAVGLCAYGALVGFGALPPPDNGDVAVGSVLSLIVLLAVSGVALFAVGRGEAP